MNLHTGNGIGPDMTSAWPFNKRRAVFFHRCADTKKIIWPGQTCYERISFKRTKYHEPGTGSSRFYIEWLSAEAYTFRALKT